MKASEIAIQNQFHAPNYPGIDNWQDCSLHNGNIIYIWEANGQTNHSFGDAYAMTPKTALECNGDPNQLQNALQTSIDSRYDSHRGHLQAYQINDETPAAFSHCEANVCHGAGGGEQYFIPNFDESVRNGSISKADDLNLDFNKDSLPISPEQISTDQKNTISQNPESTASPSQGTYATLSGAYQRETPEKASELKPKVDEARKNWENEGHSTEVRPTKSSDSIDSKKVASEFGGGARAPNSVVRGNTNNPPEPTKVSTERGRLPSQEPNKPTIKNSVERGYLPEAEGSGKPFNVATNNSAAVGQEVSQKAAQKASEESTKKASEQQAKAASSATGMGV